MSDVPSCVPLVRSTLTVAVSRIFPIHEQKQVEFRFRGLLMPSTTSIQASEGPGTTAGLNSSNSARQSGASVTGFVPGAFDPRILQFGFKVHW